MGLLARSLVEKRSIRDTLQTISSSMYDQLHLSTAAGPIVSEHRALKSSVVLACVRVISETLASMPAHVYERTANGKRRASEHPLYRLIHDQPNPLMTAYTFKETLNCHLNIWGNAYAEIVRDFSGHPVQLWPIPPFRVQEVRMVSGRPVDLEYEITLMDGTSAVLPSSHILHIPGLSYDGLLGKSPIHLAAESIGLSMATEEFTSRFFSNGAQMSGFLSHPGVLSEAARKNLKQSTEQEHGGITNAFRVMILEEGMKWQDSGMKLIDAQLLELRKFQVEDIARIFRVPLHLISATEKATSWGTGIEQFGLAFVMYCLRPWAVRWEQAIQSKLFLPEERDRYYVEFLFDSLMRGDLGSRYAAYAIARTGGWLNADEIREFENMNPIGGEAGTSYANPNTSSPPLAEPQAETMPMQINSAKRADFVPLMEAAWTRINKRAVDEIEAVVGRAIKAGDDAAIMRSIEGWLREHRAYVEAQLAPVIAAGGQLGGDNGHS